MSSTLAVETSSPNHFAAAGGVEITGIDVSKPLTESEKAHILGLFADHPILVFRNQSLSKEQQYKFTQNFGPIEELHVGRHISDDFAAVHTVSNLDKDGNPSDKLPEHGNYFWHTDKSYHDVPSLLTMLHTVVLPPSGGPTQFANTERAYAALPEATKEQKRERPPVHHPIVRTHPVRGTKSLYLGNHSSHILGMDMAAGRELLADLEAHATSPEFVYSHQWRQGDLVMWDNRCLLHRALGNYDMGTHARVLHRTVVRGSVPV